jgi:hypothetical protein
MTDFSPLEGAVMDRCASVVRAVRGSSGFGSAGEPRVNMKAPERFSWKDCTNREVST